MVKIRVRIMLELDLGLDVCSCGVWEIVSMVWKDNTKLWRRIVCKGRISSKTQGFLIVVEHNYYCQHFPIYVQGVHQQEWGQEKQV